MTKVGANGIEIEYEETGGADDPVLLLIMGLGAQLVAWDVDLFERFAAEGFRVIRFDNRDVGLSTKVETPYTLRDMAADAAGLLDALGIPAAHVAGASLGGMIAQQLAIDFPEKVLSLCSIMSTTGDPSVGGATDEAMAMLTRPPAQTRDEAIAMQVESIEVFGSKGLPIDWDRVRARAERSWDRMVYPAGIARQIAAAQGSGDRTEALRTLDVPTVVIHGADDTLIRPSGGEATAAAIPGAELLLIDGMGHDQPPAAWDQIVGAVSRNAKRAAARA
jgi:pimeloyl-ACP methyl ester carboxylesterase